MHSAVNIAIIVIAFVLGGAAIYTLYSLLLFNGGKDPHVDLQLSTKDILEQVEILYKKKEYPLLALLATKYLDRVPGNMAVREYLAKAYYEMKNINKAIAECALLIKHNPNNLEIRRVLGECYIKKELLLEALTQFEVCYQQNSENPEVVKRLGELYVETDQIYSAINAYKLYTDLISDEVEKADIFLILADLNEQVGYYPAAFEAYKQSLAVYPKDYEINKKMGNLYVKIKNPAKALEIFEYVLTFAAENRHKIWVYEMIIDLKSELEDYEGALDSANELLDVPSVDVFKTRYTIANLTIKLGNLAGGINILEDLVMLSNSAYDVTVALAMAYRKNFEFEKSLDQYRTLLDNADQKEAKIIRGYICELYMDWAMNDPKDPKHEASIRNLTLAMQYDALNPWVYYNFATISMETANHNDAVSYLQKAIEFTKNQEDKCQYYIKLSECHKALGNVFEEKKALSDLLRLDPNSAVGHMKMGVLYQSQQDLKSAEDSLVKALQFDPGLLDAKYHLALIYENHDKEKANALYTEILSIDPTYINARNALVEFNSSGN